MTFATATLPTSFLMPHGQDIDLFQMPSELTIAQAAKMLDSREGLIHELIEDGLIACRVKNGERLVQLDSLVEYRQEWERRMTQADKLFSMFREAGMSDDDD